MLIKIHSQDVSINDKLRGYIQTKLRLTLGLYHDKIQRTDIFLKDVNGPKGGKDIACKIKVKADGHTPFVSQQTTEDVVSSVNIAAHKIKRTASRRFDKLLQGRRDNVKTDLEVED